MWYIAENEEEQAIVNTDIDLPPKMIGEGGKWTSLTAPQPSRVRLFSHNKVLNKRCVICNRWAKTHYFNNEKMIARNMCFGCNLWTNRAEQLKTDKRIMVVNSYWYTIGSEWKEGDRGFKGFGGCKWIFAPFEGPRIISFNVWGGGEIPRWFSGKIRDNADIVKE